jgi:hypothetical protein
MTDTQCDRGVAWHLLIRRCQAGAAGGSIKPKQQLLARTHLVAGVGCDEGLCQPRAPHRHHAFLSVCLQRANGLPGVR